jgi:hypothetical protein
VKDKKRYGATPAELQTPLGLGAIIFWRLFSFLTQKISTFALLNPNIHINEALNLRRKNFRHTHGKSKSIFKHFSQGSGIQGAQRSHKRLRGG